MYTEVDISAFLYLRQADEKLTFTECIQQPFSELLAMVLRMN